MTTQTPIYTDEPKPAPFLRTENNYNMELASFNTGLECFAADDMTQQQFKEETDINEIVRRFGLTGKIPGDFDMPQSGDFTTVIDFHTAMNQVREAQEEFDRMPGELRKRFAYNPQNLMDFLEDPANRAEALKLGLLQPPPEQPRPATIQPGTPPATGSTT